MNYYYYILLLLLLLLCKLQIQNSIIEKIASLQVKSLPDLLQISSMIGSAIQETDTVSHTSLVSSINVARGCTV